MAIQQRNSELADLLSSEFQPRNEANFAWKSAASVPLMFTGLRGFWPMSAVGTNGEAIDLSGLGVNLGRNGDPDFQYVNLIPLCNYNGTTDYHSIADNAAHDITGAEVYVGTTFRGLVLGGWVYFDGAAAGTEAVVSKWNAGANQRAYRIIRTAAGTIQAQVSTDGTAVTTVTSAGTVGAGIWTHLVLRFIPSTELSIFINNEETLLAAAIPASIFNSSADFVIAGVHGGAALLDGRVHGVALGASALSDAIIFSWFEQTRAMFGV